ncbi:MAG: pyridoxamine 5'-phosphate oxidase [Sphingomonadaceae bacterium]
MDDPIARFAAWYAEAEAHEPNDPNACTLSTVDPDAPGGPAPDGRIVLMKGFDAAGFSFYTNRLSVKGRQLARAPAAALTFHWKSLRRQVRIRGTVLLLDDATSDAYFATRPRESQLSAWASLQSAPLDRRETFEARLAELAARYPADVPRPPHWGGYRLAPSAIEYWEDRPGRQHHRELYQRDGAGWRMTLLYP